MSVEVQKVATTSNDMIVAKFTPKTLKLATKNNQEFVCGWRRRPNADTSTHVLVMLEYNGKYRVVGDGYLSEEPHKNDARFGKDFPFTASISNVRFITDPQDFLKSPLEFPAKSISKDSSSVTYTNAARAIVKLDRLWVEGKVSGFDAISKWNV